MAASPSQVQMPPWGEFSLLVRSNLPLFRKNLPSSSVLALPTQPQAQECDLCTQHYPARGLQGSASELAYERFGLLLFPAAPLPPPVSPLPLLV